MSHFILAIFISLAVNDFLSGLVHWFADTWGSLHWRWLGPTLIRSFREHHVDCNRITQHNFIETNGANSFLGLILLLVAFMVKRGNINFTYQYPVVLFLVFLAFWTMMTNQIHKWAHSAKVSPSVHFLQKYSLILSRDHHLQHHKGLNDQSYCITTGWMNSFLNKTHFFRFLEKVITTITGVPPREEDIKIRSTIHE